MFSNGLSESARKRVELAVAVAQEKLLSDHVDHALDLVALVNEDVSFSDALQIYTRLMRLDEDEAQNVKTRVLAVLGKKAEEGEAWPEPEARQASDQASGRSWFRHITLRLRGRENEELRRRIELIAARTEVALIQTHVDNALDFVGFLKKGGEVGEQRAVELYLDALDVRESIAEVTYYMALARIADDILPPHGAGVPGPHAEVKSARDTEEEQFHAVEEGGDRT
ncbi:MAG: hypothetical protein ACOC3J_00680 [Gemmatimonadota bacterium]